MTRSTRFALTPRAEAAAEPILAINTTPLIDLMLVLLVMFIVTIPIATHKVPLDLPSPYPAPTEPRPFHQLALDAGGTLHWNGSAITEAQLAPLLAQLAADPAGPELHILVDAETRYERVDQTLAEIRRHDVTRLGFVGNERFASAIDR